jgi:NAD(P)-dependent dehydrogenase (short-subunit alcohol dehydrogenase family)
MQLGVNLRAVIIGTREALPLLREAGAEHGKALIVNTASIAGKSGQPWLSVYSATKAAVIGFSEATQKEVASDGIQVTALCPGFVDTPMTEYVRGQVSQEDMIFPRTSPNQFLPAADFAQLPVPDLVFTRPDELPGTVGWAGAVSCSVS